MSLARGGLVDEPSLAECLESGRLHAAALDTFCAEPPVGNPLLSMAQTVVTPHLAGATLDNFDRIAAAAVLNIQSFLEGRGVRPGDLVLDAV